MVPKNLTGDDWRLIKDRMAEGECVAFLGAGANYDPSAQGGLPLGRKVALELVEELTGVNVSTFEELGALKPYSALREYRELLGLGLQDLPKVAFHVELRRDPAFLMKRLRAILDDADYKPSPVLRTLARLPLRLIVTTNYDTLMERALVTAGVEHKTIVQPIGGFEDKQQADLNEELVEWGDRLVLYKIHGSFVQPNAGDASPNALGEVLVTEEDYIRYLTVAGIQDRGMPNAVAARLQTSTILFLGYGLEDWDFRTIFKSLIEPRNRHQQFASFAFQRDPAPHWVKFWSRKGVQIHDMDVTKFAERLQTKCKALLLPEPDWDAGA